MSPSISTSHETFDSSYVDPNNFSDIITYIPCNELVLYDPPFSILALFSPVPISPYPSNDLSLLMVLPLLSSVMSGSSNSCNNHPMVIRLKLVLLNPKHFLLLSLFLLSYLCLKVIKLFLKCLSERQPCKEKLMLLMPISLGLLFLFLKLMSIAALEKYKDSLVA